MEFCLCSDKIPLRYKPVYELGHAATCSGVPTATTSPPRSPPSGPRSNDIIRRFDHIKIMLNNHYRITGINQAA